jgi:hypothetical protein
MISPILAGQQAQGPGRYSGPALAAARDSRLAMRSGWALLKSCERNITRLTPFRNDDDLMPNSIPGAPVFAKKTATPCTVVFLRAGKDD